MIKESRAISQAEPGFDITARVRVLRAETEDEISITNESLRKLATNEQPGRWLVQLESGAGRYSMLADRRWKVYIDNGEEAILRMIENNSIIAQCNITRLPDLEKGKQLTLEALQSEIQRSLQGRFGEFLQSGREADRLQTTALESCRRGDNRRSTHSMDLQSSFRRRRATNSHGLYHGRQLHPIALQRPTSR